MYENEKIERRKKIGFNYSGEASYDYAKRKNILWEWKSLFGENGKIEEDIRIFAYNRGSSSHSFQINKIKWIIHFILCNLIYAI